MALMIIGWVALIALAGWATFWLGAATLVHTAFSGALKGTDWLYFSTGLAIVIGLWYLVCSLAPFSFTINTI